MSTTKSSHRDSIDRRRRHRQAQAEDTERSLVQSRATGLPELSIDVSEIDSPLEIGIELNIPESLEAAALEANALHQQLKQLEQMQRRVAAMAVGRALRLGYLLQSLKTQIQSEGLSWQAWCKESLLFSKRHADRLIRLWNEREQLEAACQPRLKQEPDLPALKIAIGGTRVSHVLPGDLSLRQALSLLEPVPIASSPFVQQRVVLSLQRETQAKLQAIAAAEGLTESALVEWIIEGWVSRNQHRLQE